MGRVSTCYSDDGRSAIEGRWVLDLWTAPPGTAPEESKEVT